MIDYISPLLLSLVLALSSFATAAVTDVFNVARVNAPGSCDPYLQYLDDDFNEALSMGKAGKLAIQKIVQGRGTQQSRRLLLAMYGIEVQEASSTIGQADLDSLNNIKGQSSTADQNDRTLIEAGVFTLTQNVPYLTSLGADFYCDGDSMFWTTKAIDESTNQPTNQPLSSVLPDTDGAYWYAKKKAYIKDDNPPAAGDGANPCKGSTGGFVNTQHNLITICYSNLNNMGWRPFLTDVKNDQQGQIQAGDELYSKFKSVPGAILHELSHLVSSAGK